MAAIIDVSGVGYCVHVPKAAQLSIGTICTLHIAFRWSSEQGPALYGFFSAFERELFNLVTSCSGIGPKLGLALLEGMPSKTIVEAIARRDEKALQGISGLGQKKAELLVHTLHDKVEQLMLHGSMEGEEAISGFTQTLHELGLALQALGYSRGEIKRASNAIGQLKDVETLAFDQVLRKALLMLTTQQ